MKKITVVALAVLMFAGSAYAACGKCPGDKKSDLGQDVVSTVTDTGKTATEGTAKTVEDSITNPVEAPKTAIEATKDTAGTALTRADAAIKTLTGDKE